MFDFINPNNKNILVLPIEVKIREFLPKLYLAFNILRNNKKFNILIGGQRFINQSFIVSNSLWFDKFTYSYKISKSISYLYNSIMMLDEEGPISFHNKLFTKMRYDRYLPKYIKYFIFSGPDDIKKLDKIYSKVTKYIFGIPKLDLLKKKPEIIFSREIKKIKKKYSNFYLFVGSATLSNTKKKIKLLERIHNKDDTDKILVDDYYNFFKVNIDNYNCLLDLSLTVARENPSKIIIFRPHPNENIEELKNFIGDMPKNFKIVFNFSVTPWILLSDLYFHSGCSTYLEAVALKKKIITYMPFSTKDHKNFTYSNPFFKKKKDVLNYIGKINDNKFLCKYNVNKKIYKIAKNLNKNLNFYSELNKFLLNNFSKRINSKFVSYTSKDNSIKNIHIIKKLYYIISLIKNYLLSKATIYFSFMPLDFYISKNQKEKKFNKISKHEMISYIKLFNLIYKKKVKINVKKVYNSTFLLYLENN